MRVIFIKKYKNYVKGNIDEIEDGEELQFLLSTKTVEKCDETADLSSKKLIEDNSKLKKELEANKKKLEELETENDKLKKEKKELEIKISKADKK